MKCSPGQSEEKVGKNSQFAFAWNEKVRRLKVHIKNSSEESDLIWSLLLFWLTTDRRMGTHILLKLLTDKQNPKG